MLDAGDLPQKATGMMVLYFSGTGNSRYIAAQIATGLCANVGSECPHPGCGHLPGADRAGYRAGDPHLRLAHPPDRRAMVEATPLPQAQRIWFVMDCGSEIGSADHYNRQLAQRKSCDPWVPRPHPDAGELYCHVLRPGPGPGQAHRGQRRPCYPADH